MSLSAEDLALRHRVYTSFAATGRPPDLDEVDAEGLQRLHDAHALVLDDGGAIRMALPFSGVPTPFRVLGNGITWWANCAWDAVAIPALLAVEATIEATWFDSGAPVDLAVNDGSLSATEGFVHFTIPSARWWDDIVET